MIYILQQPLLFVKIIFHYVIAVFVVGTFFVFRNFVEKFCVSWAFPLIECVAVWALKPPVVSAPLRSLHNRSPPDFLQLIPTYSKPTRHKVFLRNYGKQESANEHLTQTAALQTLHILRFSAMISAYFLQEGINHGTHSKGTYFL